MKLSDHVESIRVLVYKSYNNQFARLGLGATKQIEIDKIPVEQHSKRNKIEVLIKNHVEEKGSYADAREKALDELTFTLFNRLAATKVMEAHQLFPPIVTKAAEHGDRSFGHKLWLDENAEMRSEELEGIREYFKYEFNKLGETIPLFHKDYPYALFPYVIELNDIVDAFNRVEEDPSIEADIWQSDDILGWLYESYNNVKKQAHKDSKDKTEYDKVSLQSQVYTPRWVVEFLVHNSLGKLYLEMYPDSDIKTRYKIANAPKKRIRTPKPLHEIKLIDPASGSGNFLLYAFDFFYELYQDQIDNYGADYDEDDIAQLIIENNLHGIDLDDRAIQLAQLGLWIKAKQKRRSIGNLQFNVVSSDFFLPDFDFVFPIFKKGTTDPKQLAIIEEIWTDLQQAHKFGSLVRIEEKLSLKLHGIVAEAGVTLFGEEDIKEYERFKNDFFANLETAITQYATQEGNSFLTDKTKDAITFLRLITQGYDIATANPPYTDSSDFGKELKPFIEANYKKPYKFHTNLYATFIKRCFELTNEDGKIAMIHPYTFMYIKSFEDVRKYILKKAQLELLVDWGLDRVNLFDGGYASAPTFYILGKVISDSKSTFINLTTNLQERQKRDTFNIIWENFYNSIPDKRIYSIDQSKFSEIKSTPFIYWISDNYRNIFSENPLKKRANVFSGVKTGNNNGALRFWWEINKDDIFKEGDEVIKWVKYNKGGSAKKWYGNNWLCVDFKNEYEYIKKQKSFSFLPKKFAFEEKINYSGIGSKSVSFRFLEADTQNDMGASGLVPQNNPLFALAVLNSKITSYNLNCLNPTVNKQPNDVKRVPLKEGSIKIKSILEPLVEVCIKINSYLEKYSIIESYFIKSPFELSRDLNKSLKRFLELENSLLTQILLNEAIINEKVFEVYELTEADKAMVLAKEGESIGGLPVSPEARAAYLTHEITEFPLDNIRDYIQDLPEKDFTTSEQEAIISEFPQLYKSNNNLEEFCIWHQVNPINVWYWFKESNVIPKQRMNDLAMEFLADMIREILLEDDDGIIPLVPNAGETVLLDRIEAKFMEKGFSRAQYSSFGTVLGKDLDEYINKHFFGALSDHLNLFMYLPKTPFIWHLTSGPAQGFDCYIIIYKWSKDRLLSIRSRYIEQRERALENRQSDLRAKESPSAAEQNELDLIYKQLQEIEAFKQKIDELLAAGYNPILDDGVGKNIAPLQAKKMLAYEVLNKGQLKKYLNADW